MLEVTGAPQAQLGSASPPPEASEPNEPMRESTTHASPTKAPPLKNAGGEQASTLAAHHQAPKRTTLQEVQEELHQNHEGHEEPSPLRL